MLTVTPRAFEWTPTVGIIMILCNVVAIAFAKYTMKNPSAEPQIPAGNLFGGFGLPAILASTSFGHVLGAGVILGLSNIGVL
ncbi:photosystem I reaction center subunit PsaK [Myxacorys almedinensis A]|uniref:Photosystem I reaction center subunit PsaK n=1 Tax=Myxacorys almedinensis A TaxID=2690445 RepID=A0A8J7Z532_9CYAN|nr:photosystem I reaction center subunit PsaK [Myxacorys almedinensis A]